MKLILIPSADTVYRGISLKMFVVIYNEELYWEYVFAWN
jgi:hypothetical protein